ncbi:MAG: Crp/Fnr family transcriptional regulator [Bacteroidetes bacterium]|nr:Crp/Fnr family transcriptional regulator [Bacteroidota bacterium]
MMKKKISCKTCGTLECIIKRNISAQWIDVFDSSKQQVRYKEEELIIKQGDIVGGMYFILQGNVKVVVNGYHDREQIVRLATDGNILGHCGQVNETYPISAIAITPSIICFVDNTTMHDILMKNSQLLYALMMFYSRKLRKTELRMKYLGQMNVREKIAEALLYINVVFGTSHNDATLNIGSCREVIACLTGTNPDQVTKQLKDFENEKLVVKLKRRIKLVNPMGLENIVRYFGIDELFKQQ